MLDKLLTFMTKSVMSPTSPLSTPAVRGTGTVRQDIRNNAQSELKTIVNNSEVLKNLSLDQLIDQAYILDYITKDEKEEYLDLLKDLDKKHGWWESVFDFKGTQTTNIARLYGVLTEVAPEIDEILQRYTGVDVKGALASSMPQIAGAPGYTAFDVDFESPAANLEADPVKWWKGKELAEHHDLMWDLDEMYSRVKEGTSARLEADKFKSDQLLNESLRNDHLNEVAYLSQLRDTKSDAITSGATAGARAAGEILGMLGTTNEYSTNQADVANNRWNAVQESLLNDARANITANNAYMNLGKDIFSNIEYLYANDVDRRGAELNAFGNMYAADQALRGSYQEANASMAAQQAIANANIDNARASMNDSANRYAWLWDRLYGANLEKGYNDVQSRALANAQFFSNAMAESLATNANVPSSYRDYLDKYSNNK